jgi:formylglycine-generating enzyme required for sulfatase activity
MWTSATGVEIEKQLGRENLVQNDPPLRYRAFLSYSHADTAIATRVHGRLEGFRIDQELVGRTTSTGPIPETLRPIFRDRHDFDAGSPLGVQTSAALDDSTALIVLASTHAAASKHVNEEVRLFKSRDSERPVIPLIVDGKPGDPDKECFPPALRFAVTADGAITDVPVEVVAADLRESGDGFDLALAKVVSRLIGLAPDDVYRRAERERRRQNRRRMAAAGAFAAVMVVGLTAWWNQQWLSERVYWFRHVRGHVLLAENEHSLKSGDPFQECTDCPFMVSVPAGSFQMGSPVDENGHNPKEGPQHKVVISKPFAISRFDVTYEEWDACVAQGGCNGYRPIAPWGRGRQPVIAIQWDDARSYVAWLSKITGRVYRLPTEAEWEYAARAGTAGAYPFGNDEAAIGQYAWYDGNAEQRAHPVGEKSSNAFGLYDMLGNVLQWVDDCYDDDYRKAPVDGSAPSANNCRDRVIRGSSYVSDSREVRVTNRYGVPTSGPRGGNIGFRIARTLGN